VAGKGFYFCFCLLFEILTVTRVTYGGHIGDQTAFDCMKAAYDAGINFFDCAEAYAGGKSEEVMGKAIKKFGWKRNDLVISTKINWGGAFGDNPVNNGGLSRKHLIEGTEMALKRLQLDYVDLLFCHRPDRNTPIEETVRAMNYLINTGKTFYWGTVCHPCLNSFISLSNRPF
jgi:aryl-alcohol dehydrogenase-like predicted oxidoreductase